MRLTNRLVGLVLAIFLWLSVWPGRAQAAYEFYVTINGTKQGTFKGESAGRDTGRIPCLQFHYQPGASKDVAGGPSAGRRQHEQIVIVKEVDAASPQFFRAAATGEVLTQVNFEFVRLAPDGREEIYKTLRITKAVVGSVRRVANGGAKDARPLEEVTFIFEQGNLEARGSNSKPVPVERWLGIPK